MERICGVGKIPREEGRGRESALPVQVSRTTGVPAGSIAENESHPRRSQMEAIPLRYGTKLEGHPRHQLEIRQERKGG